MKRIGKRRYGRDNSVVASTNATHAIKIGYNAGEDGERVKPGKLNGFLVFRDTLDARNKLVIDFNGMKRLGYSGEQIKQAMINGFKADPELLPQELHFVLMADAVNVDGQWVYPGIYSESYECYNKAGLFCHGDGTHATRKQDDGSKRQIPCVPYGAAGDDPEDAVDPSLYCEFSGPDKPCKAHSRLIVCLYYLEGGRPVLVCPELGYQARYRFDTSSEYMGMGVLEVLDPVADRVRGRLNGITGTLLFQKKGRRTGNEKMAKSITGFVLFALDESSIRAREMQIAQENDRSYERQIEAARVGSGLMIEAPVTTHVDAIVQAEEFEIDDASEAEPINTPNHPVFYDPDPEPEPETLTVETATDRECAQALDRACQGISLENDEPYTAALGRLAYFDHASAPDGVYRIESIDWFFDPSAKRPDARLDILRGVCLKLSDAGNPFFELKRETE